MQRCRDCRRVCFATSHAQRSCLTAPGLRSSLLGSHLFWLAALSVVVFHTRMKFALISVLALFAFVQETPWVPFNDAGSRRHPERVSTIDVGHYKISVRVDDRIPPPLVEGLVEIDLALTAPAENVELDAAEMTINEIVSGDGTKLEFTHEAEKLA